MVFSFRLITRCYAAASFTEGLQLARDVGDVSNTGYFLKGLAGVIAQKGEATRAARLIGAAEALLEASHSPASRHDTLDAAFHDRLVAALQSALGGLAFAAAWSAGQELTPGEAMAEGSERSASSG